MPWGRSVAAMGEAMREALGELAQARPALVRRRAGAPYRHRAGPFHPQDRHEASMTVAAAPLPSASLLLRSSRRISRRRAL